MTVADVERGWESSIIRESLRGIILRLLAEKPMHGYEIMKMIEKVTDGRWKPASGTIYPLLDSMRKEGLIDIEKVENEGVRGGRRVVYRLTEKGWRELAGYLVAKAEYKAKMLRFYIVEGAYRIRDAGYEEEYKAICAKLSQELKDILEGYRDCA